MDNLATILAVGQKNAGPSSDPSDAGYDMPAPVPRNNKTLKILYESTDDAYCNRFA